MDAYLVPLVAALAGGFAAAVVLGTVRLGRRWPWWRGEEEPASPGVRYPAHAPPDRVPPALAHRATGAALLLGLIGVLLFAGEGGTAPGAGPLGLSAAALLFVWGLGGGTR